MNRPVLHYSNVDMNRVMAATSELKRSLLLLAFHLTHALSPSVFLSFSPSLSPFPLSVSSSGSLRLLMRKPTRPSGTGTGWTLSWTGWPACCRSLRMSSPSWTSCPCCAWQSPTSVSKASSKVEGVKKINAFVSRGKWLEYLVHECYVCLCECLWVCATSSW